MKYFSTILFTLLIANSLCQNLLEKANFSFRMKDYYDALVQYNDLLSKTNFKTGDTTKVFIHYRIGECYRQFLHYNDAIKWFEKTFELEYNRPEFFLSYASALIMKGEYQKAKEFLELYMEKINNNPEAELLHRSCEFAIESSKENSIYYIINQAELNTEFSDYGICIIAPNKLILSSSRGERDPNNYFKYNGQPYSDFFYTEYDSTTKKWKDPIKLPGFINSNFNEGTVSYHPPTQTLYFMQCNGYDGKDSVCNIYTSKYDDKNNMWQKPKLFDINSKTYNIGHPTISSNGDYLFFVSDMPGGYGKKDIWYSVKDKTGKWSQPINAGPEINTKQDEMFPHIFEDSIFYFSSNGRIGFGGLDIFYSKFKNGKFSKAENLEYPFNSSADDFGIYLLSWDSGFFCSNRPGGKGDDDIFTFKQIKGQIKVSGTVSDNQTGNPIEHAFVIIQGSDNSIDSTWTDSKGFYNFNNLAFDVDYIISAHKEGYLGDSKTLSTKNVKKPREVPREKRYIMDLFLDLNFKTDLNFKLIPITKEEIKINNIYYDYGKWDLRDSSKIELDKLVHLLNVNPTVKILINSHTDARSSEEFNLKLSQNRAQAVVNYLIEKGISPDRLFAKGWGESKLLIKNATTEEEHQLNRRTTFSIVNYDEVVEGYSKVRYENIPNIHGGTFPQLPKETKLEKSEKKGIIFKVQIAASKTNLTDQTLITLQDSISEYKIEYRKYNDGYYRYSMGNFSNYTEAQSLLEKIQKLGIEAFIIATEKDKIIPLNQISNVHKEKNDIDNLQKTQKKHDNATKAHFEISKDTTITQITKSITQAKDSIILKVQIAASRSKIKDKNFEIIYNQIPEYKIDIIEEDGLYRYTMGNFNNYHEANKLIERLEQIGFKSFLIAYHNSKRIQLSEALKKLNISTTQEKEIRKSTAQQPTLTNPTSTPSNNKDIIDSIYIKIQIAASKRILPDTIFSKIKNNIPQFNIEQKLEEDGLYRYYFGKFNDYSLAQITLKKLNLLGYKGFFVGFKNEQKISLNIALKYLEKQNTINKN